MTKTLTEQWREGKLPEDTYYVQFICGRYGVYEFEQFKGFGFDNDLAYIKEVLAPVPSYDEYKQLVSKTEQLEKKLEIALEVLGIIAMHSKDPVDAVQAACAISQIKEMEGIK